NTLTEISEPEPDAVHPRWRGEHAPCIFAKAACAGSSPLARGTRRVGRNHRQRSRFIPAGAGNTLSAWRSGAPAPVHPRWRGEHPSGGSPEWTISGSSPLARGTLHRDAWGADVLRFIPA